MIRTLVDRLTYQTDSIFTVQIEFYLFYSVNIDSYVKYAENKEIVIYKYLIILIFKCIVLREKRLKLKYIYNIHCVYK